MGFDGIDCEKLIEAIRARDETLIATELESIPTDRKERMLLAAFLFVSHETPYSHPIPAKMVDLLKEHTSSTVLCDTILGFWKQRPSTAIVLIMKFAELLKIPLREVLLWLLSQDGWMRKAWGWEIIQTCLEKADGLKQQPHANGNEEDSEEKEDAPAEEMQVDQNGTVGNEKKEMLETIVSNVGKCYSRQSQLDGVWLKEWFAMAVRKFGDDVDGLETSGTTGWVTETVDAAKEYRKKLA